MNTDVNTDVDTESARVQVLTALDRADRELGFVHGDMRIANIMEHRPSRENKDPEFLPRGYHVAGSKRSSRKRAEEAAADAPAILTSEDKFHLPGVGMISVVLNVTYGPLCCGKFALAVSRYAVLRPHAYGYVPSGYSESTSVE